ncbi:MAG: SMP-30/gluconolactonase/LRE family protein [Flavobacteriaceae bacterium]
MRHLPLVGLPICLLLISCQTKPKGLIAENASLEIAGEGFSFTEGPAVDKRGNVFFTDQPNDRILVWEAGTGKINTYMEPAGRANGLYFDHHENLLAAADEKFELWRIGKDKKTTILVKGYDGLQLNGPNDIWVAPNNGIYFTDPYYQRPYWERKQKEIKEERVYYLAPDGTGLQVVATDLVQPNGIIGTPDGKTLFVADIGDQKTYVYDIGRDGSLLEKTLFAPMGSDGMTMDNQGNVYLTGDGVTVFSPQGEKILHIPVPGQWTANVTFGGPKEGMLFITAMDKLYTLKMNVNGVRWH